MILNLRLWLWILLVALGFDLAAEEIHREKSLYRNIVVKEQHGRRCLVFSIQRTDRNQSCIKLQEPNKLVFPYVKMTMGGLLLNNKPQRILVIGLGGVNSSDIS